MYQPYPSGGQDADTKRPEPPASVLTAVKLMYAGAVVSALSLILILVTIGSLKAAVHHSDLALTGSRLHTTQTATIVVAILFAVVGLGLWLWLASKNKAGKNWARITASVIFGLDTLAVAADFSRPDTLASRLASIVIWLIGLGVIVLLWRRESSTYYQAAHGT
jgi:cytochrome bd-type quinol oxidase subunit 2